MSRSRNSLKYEYPPASPELAQMVFGPESIHLKLLEKVFDLKIVQKGGELSFTGDEANRLAAEKVLEVLYRQARANGQIAFEDVDLAIQNYHQTKTAGFCPGPEETLLISASGRRVCPKTPAQKAYVEAIAGHDLVFGLGPAGTGKTYLAMAMAVLALNQARVARLVLTRPAVEAGERLGFLPGDLAEKVNPYLRPLYDALDDLVPYEKYVRFMERRVIEVAPLAFMRGRTLSDAFVILDEAQNCTPEQMKMFLTRLGPRSKAVVTGDDTQSDLPPNQPGGLDEARRVLRDVEGIAFHRFTRRDVVRHRLVRDIIEAYERNA